MNISVIIPTYRPQDYLWQCLDSFAAQTLDKRLWEVIVVLNGEAGEWLKLLKNYQEAHSEMNLQIIHTETAGVSNARNMGLDIAKGDYIGFVDDDDYVSPVYLEELVSKSGKDTVALAHPMAFEKAGVFIENYSIENTYLSIKDKGQVPYLKAQKVFQGPCMKLFHKDMIRNHRFDVTFKNGEDALFMFLISGSFRLVDTTSEDAIYYRRIRYDGANYGKKSRKYIVHNSFRLIGRYCIIYFSHPFVYSFHFFITRVLGALHTCLSNR